jgi:hypothetical protein
VLLGTLNGMEKGVAYRVSEGKATPRDPNVPATRLRIDRRVQRGPSRLALASDQDEKQVSIQGGLK